MEHHIPIHRKFLLAGFILCLVFATACDFTTSNSGDIYANVPYYAQEQVYYCAAAVVQMIAKWSGVDVSQDEAFVFMNGDYYGGGVYPSDFVRGIVNYTSERDAYWDQTYFTDNNFLARQISSVTNKIPVAAITQGGYHSVVLFGGSWHATVDSSNNRTYYWDDVDYHDPARGGGIRDTAAVWASLNCGSSNPVCEQIISNSAALAGPKTLADYDPTVYVTGSDIGTGGGPKQY